MVVDAPLPRLDPAVLELGAPGDMRARLVQAVLTGAKTATTCLQVLHDLVGQPPPVPGQRATVVDSACNPVAEVEFTTVEHRRLAAVDLDIAVAEGEGFTSVADWRAVHEAFWNRYREAVRASLGDPSWALSDDTVVVVERFRLLGPG
jgi:uncharacterized protein YhfF